MKPWLGILGLVCAALAWGQAHDEGVAAGRAANPTLRAFINAPSAQSVVPGYNSAPPETGYYGLPNLAAPSAALLAQCRAAGPADVRCQAITAHDRPANPRPAIASTDPAVVAATAIANDPAAILGAITGTYAACGTQQRLVSSATFDQQSSDYYRRAQTRVSEDPSPCARRLELPVGPDRTECDVQSGRRRRPHLHRDHHASTHLSRRL
jgi:conjugal transfer mating pair stabilization protein TraN